MTFTVIAPVEYCCIHLDMIFPRDLVSNTLKADRQYFRVIWHVTLIYITCRRLFMSIWLPTLQHETTKYNNWCSANVLFQINLINS